MEINAGGSPGTLQISAFGTAPLAGSGVLLYLRFNVIGEPPSFTNLNFGSFTFNEGEPCANTANGSIAVRGTISGSVFYGTSSMVIPVPGTTLAGSGSIDVEAVTADDGSYLMANFGAGEYVVTPSKAGDVNGIAAFDASLISRLLVGLETITANQQVAADVSNNGLISSFDAALLAQYVVDIPNSGIAGTWKFIPASRTYQDIGTETAQDYDAILVGEVSGNWTPPAALGLVPKSASMFSSKVDPLTLSLPDLNAQAGDVISVDALLGGTMSQQINAYQFDLLYDPNVIRPLAEPYDVAGTLSGGMSVAVNQNSPGVLRVAVYGSGSIADVGTLIRFRFEAIGPAGSGTTIALNRLLFNEGSPAVAGTGGHVTIGGLVAPAAPSGLTATANTSGITLGWTDSALNEDGFAIERCRGRKCRNFTEIARVGQDVTAFTDAGVARNSEYRYRVRAYNLAGFSEYSNIAAAATPRR